MGNTFGGGGGAVANGADALVAAALVKDHVKVKELLAAEGVDPAAQDAQGNHGLGAACCSGSGECVAALLAASQSPDSSPAKDLKNGMGCSPVWLAAGYGHLEILQKLLDAGADADAPNGTGDTPLIAAASRAHEPCIQALIAAGADVSGRNRNNDSLLTLAAGRGLSEVVEAALAAVAAKKEEASAAASAVEIVNAPNAKGITPVAAAAAFGDARSVRALVAEGADTTAYRDKNGATALMVACHCSNHECVTAILQGQGQGQGQGSGDGGGDCGGGGDLEAADSAGATALWLAAAAGCEEAVAALLAAGADKLGGSPGGVAAAAAATKNGHSKCAELLA